jgi:(2Fe-2S) ferredoxin
MKNLEELKEIRERVRKNLEMRTGDFTVKIVVCLGTCGIAAGARQTMNKLAELIAQSGRTDIIISTTGCAGFCEQEPMIKVQEKGKEPVTYGKVDVKAAEDIFNQHVLKGQIVQKYLFTKGE